MTEVDPQGPAAQRGIQTGDVILNVGGKAVANVGDVRSELAQAKSSGKNSVLLQVKSAGSDAVRRGAAGLSLALPAANSKGGLRAAFFVRVCEDFHRCR